MVLTEKKKKAIIKMLESVPKKLGRDRKGY